MYNGWLIKAFRAFSVGLCFFGCVVCADASVGRDPTEPFSVSEEEGTKGATGTENGEKAATGFVLGAVLISGNDKFAIINNKLVKVGDTIGTSKVKTIDAYHVTLVGETGETELQLFGRPIKEPAK